MKMAYRFALGRFAALSLLALMVAGCGGGTVAPADMCVGAVCTGGCDTNKDCLSGKRCEVTSMKCVDCVADADCPAGELCRLEIHACVLQLRVGIPVCPELCG